MPNQCCYVCGKIFSNASSLRRHARNFHKDAADEIAPNLYKNSTKYNFNCQCDIQNKITRYLKDMNCPTKLQIIKNILANIYFTYISCKFVQQFIRINNFLY
ncbi:unnamed protein product [Psylliodes chrysocephalus]|uniref:C2H2-type domain-containing protein n=1 Tax=Psylliodes chrysocephalus TaxID=3402493 RepID=A0A9P0CZ63_9CUCU|nr:unnamed protein product [Psylliodes chrysocephala]